MNSVIDSQIGQPKTYLDKETRRNSNFFFVSYSHKDCEVVFSVLNKLYDAFVNYWYDVNLDPGDVWNERVKGIMSNEHCHGAIVFLSENALISNAVQEEIKSMEELRKERDFRIIPIIVGAEDAESLILSTGLKNKSFVHNIQLFLNITQNGIWLKYDEAIEKIIGFSQRDNVKDSHTRSFLSDLDYVSKYGERLLLMGEYPTEDDGVAKDIEWIEVCNKGDLFFFVSKYCLDFVEITKISGIINEVKQTMADRDFIEDILLINEDFINENFDVIKCSLPTNYADRHRQQLLRLFWVLEGNGKNFDTCVLYNINNYKINAKIQYNSINGGVRLVLIINNKKIGDKKDA